MKLTWFGDRSFRLHLGGQIVVIEADAAPEGVDRAELRSGADLEVAFSDAVPSADPMTWRARPAERLLDVGAGTRPVEVWSIGDGAILLDADDERPLLVLTGAVGPLGRWAGNAVAVLAGTDIAQRARQLIEVSAPRLIALAGSEPEIDAAFAALRDNLDGTGLVALEAGLAVEV